MRFFRIFCFCLTLFCCVPLSRAQVVGSDQDRLRLARNYLEAGETEKALSLYKTLYEESPQIHVYTQYLNCLEEMGEYDQARRLIRRQMKTNLHPLLLEVDMAGTYYKEGSIKKMESALKKVIAEADLMGGGVSAQELAVKIEEKTGRYDYAIAVYLKAREEQCRQRKASMSGLYLLETGREAEGYSPCQPDLYAFELAELYRKDGQYGPMIDEYGVLLERDISRTEEVFSRLQSLSTGSDRTKVLEQLRRLLLQRVQKQSQNAAFQRMLIWVLLQEEDFKNVISYAKAYSRRFSDGGYAWFDAIEVIAANRKFDLAEESYQDFIENGSGRLVEMRGISLDDVLVRQSKVNLLNLYFDRLELTGGGNLSEVIRLKDAYRRLFDELGKVPESFILYRNLARIYAYYTKEKDSACALLRQGIDSRRFNARQTAELKIDLADILLYYNKVWDATLLYSQVEKDFKQDAVGFYAKLQNARLSYYIGEFEWAKSQLDVLKAATAKLIANDAMDLYLLIKENINPDSTYEGLYYVAQADFNIYRGLYPQALEYLDKVLTMPMEGALFDDVNYRKAKVYLLMEKVDEAIACLQKVFQNPNGQLLADDALFLLAEILALRSGCTGCLSGLSPVQLPSSLISGELSGLRSQEQRRQDVDASLSYYRKVFTDYRSSSLASVAREKYRYLREITSENEK